MTVHLVTRDLCGVGTGMLMGIGQASPRCQPVIRGTAETATLDWLFSQGFLAGRKFQSPQGSPILFKHAEEITQDALPGLWCVFATEAMST